MMVDSRRAVTDKIRPTQKRVITMEATTTRKSVNFLRGVPAQEALEQLVEAVSSGYRKVVRHYGTDVLQYGHFGGFKPLRALIGQMHGVDAERVIAGNGGMEVISLFFKSLPRQSLILIEETTYDRVVSDALRYGHRLIGVPMGLQGLDLDAFVSRVESNPEAAVFYGIPFHHNPTGLTYTVENRRAVETICKNRRIRCAWDICYESLRYDGHRNEPIEVSDWGPILFSSFTKTISPGTKCGYMVLPADLVDPVTEVLSNTRLNPNLPSQAFIADFIDSGTYFEFLDRLCKLYKPRMEALNQALGANFPGSATVDITGGFFATLELPNIGPDKEKAFISAAGQAGVNISAAWDAVAPDLRTRKQKDGMFIRLTFPACEPEMIAWGIGTLKEVEEKFK